MGALVAVERDVAFGGILDAGVKVDAIISAELLNTVFYPSSVLHDMGVVIRDGRVAAASVQFPLADIEDIQGFDASLGSRHRAAVGLSQECDAVIMVVSEQTGTISLALAGKLQRGLTVESLRSRLGELLAGNGRRSAGQTSSGSGRESSEGS